MGRLIGERRLTVNLGLLVRMKYGNPIVIWILLNIIVPVVVRLVIEWWLNRGKVW